MWKTISKLWLTISLVLETVDSATRTLNNVVTTAEMHSENFKAVSIAELQAKQAEAESKAKKKIAALKEVNA